MTALTLHQPWATLMAIGAKSIETRSWSTPYRGLLAIHASSRWSMALASMNERIARDLFDLGWCDHARVLFGNTADVLDPGLLLNPAYCRGRIVCIVYLHAVYPITIEYQVPPRPECDHGDFSTGRYAWHTQLVHRFDDPPRAIGRRQLWEWEVPVEFRGAKWLDIGKAAHERPRGKRTGRSAVGKR